MIAKLLRLIKKSTPNQNETTSKDEKKQTKEEEYIPNQIEMWKFIFKYIKVDYKNLVLRNFYYIYTTYVYVITPFILLEIKNAISEQSPEKMKWEIIKYITIQGISQVLSYFDTYLNFNHYQDTQQRVQRSILENLLSKDIQYFEDNKVTQISEIVKQGSESICHEVSYGQIYQKIDSFVCYIAKMYFIYCQSPILLANLILTCFVCSGLLFYLGIRRDNLQKQLDKKNDMLDFLVDDILNNINVIKTFGTELKETSRINKQIQKNSDDLKQITFLGQIISLARTSSYEVIKYSIILQIFFQIGLTGTVNAVAQSITEIFNSIHTGINMASEIYGFLFQKTENYYQEGKKHIGKVMNLFRQQPTIPQNIFAENMDKSQFSGDITFENVKFQYPVSKDVLAKLNQKSQEEEKQKNEIEEKQKEQKVEEEKDQQTSNKQELKIQRSNSIHSDSIDSDSPSSAENLVEQQSKLPTLVKAKSSMKERDYVLDGVSFTIKKGQLVAFVGTSGSGKSTIVKLLQRYYDINSGSILFDGENIKDVSLNKLRRSIGLVNQEPTLFDNDIEYNITYGCQDGEYTQEELKKICEMSGVSEFVFDEKRFPKGLKTLVGSKGMKLSGGQKQRVAIARALIKKPKILILDEATSALDSESEHLVQQYIDQLVGYKGLTIIVVAHRLSTIIKSDKIFVMKHGEIREEGTHNELISQNGIYKKLIHHQIQFSEKLQK